MSSQSPIVKLDVPRMTASENFPNPSRWPGLILKRSPIPASGAKEGKKGIFISFQFTNRELAIRVYEIKTSVLKTFLILLYQAVFLSVIPVSRLGKKVSIRFKDRQDVAKSVDLKREEVGAVKSAGLHSVNA